MAPRAPKKTDATGSSAAKKTEAAASKKSATTASKPKGATIRKRAVKAAPVLIEVPVPAAAIAERAYFIAISGDGGDEISNWLRAEQELALYAAA